MSKSLAMGLAGAAIGSFFGPSGAMYGYAIGSTIGSLLFGPKIPNQEGPRLSDLQIQTSTEGQPIPKIYGTMRPSGNIFWGKPLNETRHKKKVKGGKGKKKSAKQITYTYSIDFALGISERVSAFRRIWADGKLIMDYATLSAEDAAIVSAGGLASRTISAIAGSDALTLSLADKAGKLRFYFGTEDQLPDPLIEADLGVGNTSAYRGLAYIVFDDFQLADYGNRPPNITVEVLSESNTLGIRFLGKIDIPDIPDSSPYREGTEEKGTRYTQAASLGVDKTILVSLLQTQSSSTPYSSTIPYILQHYAALYADSRIAYSSGDIFTAPREGPHGPDWDYHPYEIPLPVSTPYEGIEGVFESDSSTDEHYTTPIYGNPGFTTYMGSAIFGTGPEPENDPRVITKYTHVYSISPVSGAISLTCLIGEPDPFSSEIRFLNVHSVQTQFWRGDVFWAIGGNFADVIYRIPGVSSRALGYETGYSYRGVKLVVAPPPFKLIDYGYVPANGLGSALAADVSIRVFVGETRVFIAHTRQTASTSGGPHTSYPRLHIRSSTDFSLIESINLYGLLPGIPLPAPGVAFAVMYDIYTKTDNEVYIRYVQSGDGTLYTIVKLEIDTKAVTVYGKLDETELFSSVELSRSAGDYGLLPHWVVEDNLMVLYRAQPAYVTPYSYTDVEAGEIRYYALTGLEEGAVTLADITADICDSVDLTSKYVDVLSLASIPVRGFIRNSVMPARSALEPLMSAFFVDVVDSGDKLVFKKRGEATVATIPAGDLGATTDENPSNLLVTEITQENELPIELALQYVDPDKDYQVGSQRSIRQIPKSQTRDSINFPISFTGTEAKQIAEKLHYAIWEARASYSFSLPLKYLRLEPGDAIGLPVDGFTKRVRLTRIDLGEVLNCEAVSDYSSIYTSVAVASDTRKVTAPMPIVGSTIFTFLDIPILGDSDNYPGVYVAATGTGTDWAGAILSKSIDGGITFTTEAELLSPATMGTVTTLLPASAYSTIWDDGTTIIVRLASPGSTLETVSEAAALAGDNTAVIGAPGRWEVVTYKNAVLNGDGTYTVSGLLRGRQGTEWAMPLHLVNDTFVLLDASAMLRIDVPITDLGIMSLYQVATITYLEELETIEYFTYQGYDLKPYAPVHLTATQHVPAANDWTIDAARRSRLSHDWLSLVDVPLGEVSEAYELDVLDGATVVRTIASPSLPIVYTEAMQITDFGVVQTDVSVSLYQMSGTVGRGFAATLSTF